MNPNSTLMDTVYPTQTEPPSGNAMTPQPFKPSQVGGGVPVSRVRGDTTSIGAVRPNGSCVSPIERHGDGDDESNEGSNNSHQDQDQRNGVGHEQSSSDEEEAYDEEEEYKYMEQLNRAMKMGLQEGNSTDEEQD
ncbi:unnamed protein product [Cylindrotheca closterium]|uniref:Uncharacterized protein n=1 Tax=Cylindrotheca closterium TaxID=2856 RepID=A0AAD2CCW8_9STRA|nr:unnamed protein product [Cylindrotheca closterium]CAJ1940705.1 unnamed protein product [Cylindrotheca closterium]